MKRLPLRTLALMSAALAVTPATARTTITPYVEVQQLLTADLSGNGGDTVTYTGLTGGVDATFDSPKFKGQVDYRYDHYFALSKRFRDSDIHNGLASLLYQATPDLSLQGSGIATRARGSFAGASPGLVFGNLAGTQQIYGIQAGPTYKRSFGNVDAQADYRFGWVRSADGIGTVNVGPDQAALQNNFTTLSHTADASVGMRPGTAGLPFGWKVSGGYEHDDIHFLDSRYSDKYGRVDLTFPVTTTIALEAGAGYEAARASQSAILVDPLTDDAVLDSGNHLQADHTKPRLLAYDESGLIWDVGVLWRPSTRTELEVRGGQRYGQAVFTGHFTHKLTPTASMEVVAYDDITSFGRQLSGEIGSLPTSFTPNTLPFASTLSTCAFGANGGQGGCFNSLNSVNSNFYRARGVFALVSGTRGLWDYGMGIGYENRRYIAPASLGAADVLSFDGAHEQSVNVDASHGRRLSRRSELTVTGLVAWYDNSGIDNGNGSYTAYGVIGTYSYEFSHRLIGSASFGITSGTGGSAANNVAGTALIALRYQL